MKKMKRQPFHHYVVLDFEATCERDSPDYNHEIIEFPVALVSINKQNNNIQIVDQLQLYIKPVRNPTLTDFCTELTGITQDKVDNGISLTEALQTIHKWLQSHQLIHKEYDECLEYHYSETELRNELKQLKGFSFVTDGPWDIRDYLEKECIAKRIEKPFYYSQWINMRSKFAEFYNQRGGINKMLSHLKMKFEGREHSGLDDSKNIARICIRMIQDGCVFDVNDSIYNYRSSIKMREKRRNQKSALLSLTFEVAIIIHANTSHTLPLLQKPNSLNSVTDEIIEIGAIAFNTKTFELVGEPFYQIVKPKFDKTVNGSTVPDKWKHELEQVFTLYIQSGTSLESAFKELRNWLTRNNLIKAGKGKKQSDQQQHQTKRPATGIIMYSEDTMNAISRDCTNKKVFTPKNLLNCSYIVEHWNNIASQNGWYRDDMYCALNCQKHEKQITSNPTAAKIQMTVHLEEYRQLICSMSQ
jgi:inhibitor of KinA sporulation pathway (predicted exonuclease)